MTIWNFGSINIDHVYTVPHMPAPGETLAALDYRRGLGGKGANQSVAAARAGARVLHIGAVGPGGEGAPAELQALGVDTAHVAQIGVPAGHAIITVDPAGENAIVIYPGANAAQEMARVAAALHSAAPGDLLLMQNETSLQSEAAAHAAGRGLRVIYSAAPFDADAVRAVLPHLAMLVMNAVEADQLTRATGQGLADLPVPDIIVTRGAEGAEWISAEGTVRSPAFRVAPVDTTGAGDCFIGSLAAALDRGLGRDAAMRYASAAAALQVTRPGACDAMPARAEVDAFLTERS